MTDMELLRQQKAICRLVELVAEHASIGAQMRGVVAALAC